MLNPHSNLLSDRFLVPVGICRCCDSDEIRSFRKILSPVRPVVNNEINPVYPIKIILSAIITSLSNLD